MNHRGRWTSIPLAKRGDSNGASHAPHPDFLAELGYGISPADRYSFFATAEAHNSRRFSRLVDSLYLEAERLEWLWRNAPLPVDFRDRMIDAVFRFISRNNAQISAKEAASLLRLFWNRNARRDAARSRHKPRMVPLDTADIAVFIDPTEDTFALLDRCRDILLGAGMRSEVIEAFIQQLEQGTFDDIIGAVEVTTGFQVAPATLRQWRHRHFPKAIALLRSSADLGLVPA